MCIMLLGQHLACNKLSVNFSHYKRYNLGSSLSVKIKNSKGSRRGQVGLLSPSSSAFLLNHHWFLVAFSVAVSHQDSMSLGFPICKAGGQ